MRYLVALALVIVAAVSGWAATQGPLHYLWSDYQDSPTSTYLIFGLPPVLIALGALAGAVYVVRR